MWNDSIHILQRRKWFTKMSLCFCLWDISVVLEEYPFEEVGPHGAKWIGLGYEESMK